MTATKRPPRNPRRTTLPAALRQELRALICVDVETSGPCPSLYSLLAIGACTVAEPERTFYVELQPVTERQLPEAMDINQLSLESLKISGIPPKEAMASFGTWLRNIVPPTVQPIFVAFNAPFDWMFVNDYFHRYLGSNPFGYKALDIKAYFMGLHGVPWARTSHRDIVQHYPPQEILTHHALEDAQGEARLFREMLPSKDDPGPI